MKKIDLEDPAEKLAKARMQLLMAFPFFGELVMRMVFHESKTAGVGTTCVDHKGNMFYHPDWVKGFVSIQETMFELAHEVIHLVQRCTVRFPQGGDHRLWNMAADIKDDTILVDAGMKQSRVSAKNITPELMEKHRHRTTEQVYYYLKQHPEEAESFGGCPHQQQGGCPHGGDGEETPQQGQAGSCPQCATAVGERGCISGSVKEADQETIEKWKQHVIAAAQNAKARGKLPGFADEFLAEIRRPSINWKHHIRQAATEQFRGRYGYPRPNRRARAMLATSSQGMRLPCRTKSPNGAVIMIDTSGSISDTELSQFVSECAGILRETGCQFLKIYFHDTKCYHIEEYNLESIKKIKVTRGGTSHVDVFDKVNESNDRIGMVVAFTDLQTEFPSEVPSYPVLWGHPPEYQEEKVPFGTKLKVDLTT